MATEHRSATPRTASLGPALPAAQVPVVYTAADETPRWRAVAVLVLGACVIGFSPILVRLTETGPAAAGICGSEVEGYLG